MGLYKIEIERFLMPQAVLKPMKRAGHGIFWLEGAEVEHLERCIRSWNQQIKDAYRLGITPLVDAIHAERKRLIETGG